MTSEEAADDEVVAGSLSTFCRLGDGVSTTIAWAAVAPCPAGRSEAAAPMLDAAHGTDGSAIGRSDTTDGVVVAAAAAAGAAGGGLPSTGLAERAIGSIVAGAVVSRAFRFRDPPPRDAPRVSAVVPPRDEPPRPRPPRPRRSRAGAPGATRGRRVLGGVMESLGRAKVCCTSWMAPPITSCFFSSGSGKFSGSPSDPSACCVHAHDTTTGVGQSNATSAMQRGHAHTPRDH